MKAGGWWPTVGPCGQSLFNENETHFNNPKDPDEVFCNHSVNWNSIQKSLWKS